MEKERKDSENIESMAEQAAEGAPLFSDDGYHPRPTWQKVLAWVLLAIVIVGIVLWYLEIATAGALFGLLS